MLLIRTEQLSQIRNNALAKWMHYLLIHVLQITYVVSLHALPCCSIVAAEIDVVDEEIGSEDQQEVQSHQRYCIPIECTTI